jgi:hypothetical protein
VAPSSSANRVAKLASRGKGKKVRFQSGTTFPLVLAIVSALVLALIVYSRATLPSAESGAPQPGDSWAIAYGVRVCDEWLPSLSGTSAELTKDASTGDQTKVATGSDADGIIHYHPQTKGNTGRKARLGVFLNVYGLKLSDTVLELPANQVGPGETRKWDTKSFKCNGKSTQIRVRVWKDYTKSDFVDNVTDFGNLRFTNNGMVFAIAIEPRNDNIPVPDSASKLAGLGVIGSGTGATTTVPGSSTTTAGTTPATGAATSTTVAATTTVPATTPATGAATTTTGG